MGANTFPGRQKCQGLHIAALAAAGVAMPFAAAHADVLQLEANGTVTTYSRPMIFNADGATQIGPATTSPGKAGVAQALNDAGSGVELSPLLIEAVAWAESRFNAQARSRAGAIGVMQLMPGTAAQLGVDPNDATANIHGGARYLRQMLVLFNGDIQLALAAYNAGPAAVQRYNGVPPYRETRAYVAAVLDYMARRTQEDAAR